MAEPRPAPFFIGDDLALDFLNSIAAPWGPEIEWLTNGGDLVAWLEQAHAVPADVSAHFAHIQGRAALMRRHLRRASCANGFAYLFANMRASRSGGGLCTI